MEQIKQTSLHLSFCNFKTNFKEQIAKVKKHDV